MGEDFRFQFWWSNRQWSRHGISIGLEAKFGWKAGQTRAKQKSTFLFPNMSHHSELACSACRQPCSCWSLPPAPSPRSTPPFSRTRSREEGIHKQNAGYMKAAWPGFWGAFLRSGRGARESPQKCGGRSPSHFARLPRDAGPARPQKCTPKNTARLPSGYYPEQVDPNDLLRCPTGPCGPYIPPRCA